MLAQYRDRISAVLCGTALLLSLAARCGAQKRTLSASELTPTFTSADRIVVDVHIDDNLHRALVGRDPGNGDLLLPLRDLMSFTGIRTHTRLGTIRASGEGSRPSFELNADRRTLRVQNGDVQLLPGDLLVQGDAVFVSSVIASRLLDVTVAVDVPNASVLLRDAAALPVVRRWRAVTGARRADSVRVSAESAVDLIPEQRIGIQGDYALFLRGGVYGPVASAGEVLPGRGGTTWSADLESRLSARVAGGSLSGRATTITGGSTIRDVLWSRSRPASTRVTHVALGAVDAGGLTGARVQGISIDNFPVDYSSRRSVRVHGRAENGWEYTALKDGIWNAADRPADGEYEFRLPMIGDVARVDVMAWGPDGQERRSVRSVHAAPMRVDRGRLQYAVTAGRCSRERYASYFVRPGETTCTWFAGAESRYGLTNWLVLRSGIDAIPGAVAPYIGVGGVIGQSTTIQAATTLGRSVQRNGAWSVQYEPTPAFSAAIARSTSINGLTTDLASLHVSPLRWSGRVAFDGWLTGTSGTAAKTQSGHAGIIGMRNGVRLELFASRTETGSSAAVATRVNSAGVDATVAPSWLRIPKVQRSWLSGSVERQDVGGWRGTWRANSSLSRAYVEIARTFAASNQAARWTVTITPRTGSVRQTTMYSRSDAVADLPSQSTLLHTLSGSAAWQSGAARLAFSSEPAANRGSIVGLAFLDLNRNGRQDAGEPGIGDLPVTVGNRLLHTDSTGHFRSPHMTASESIEISVDSTEMPSACWRAAAPRWRVRAAEGGVTAITLPILRGGILEGQIEKVESSPTGGRPMPIHWAEPPRMQIVSVSNGTSFDIDVFVNGTFYLLRVPFGTYTMRVPQADQKRLGLSVAESQVEIRNSLVDNPTDATSYNGCPLTTAIVRAHALHESSGTVLLALPDETVGAETRREKTDSAVIARLNDGIAAASSLPTESPAAMRPRTSLRRHMSSTHATKRPDANSNARVRIPVAPRRRAHAYRSRRMSALHRRRHHHTPMAADRPPKRSAETGALPRACGLNPNGKLFVTSSLWSLHYCVSGFLWKP